MEETVISLETARLLKEKGYRDELCRHYYDFKGKLQVYNGMLNCPLGDVVDAPTQSLAQQWIREKGIHIEVYANASGWGWILTKCGGNGSCIKEIEDDTFFDTHEEALEEGLKKALKLI